MLNDRWRALAVRLRSVRGWLALGALVVAGTSGARLAGIERPWLGAVQLVPTVVLIAALAAALDIALSEFSPGADGASAAAVALAVHDELVREAPAALVPGLLLYGAGASGPHALRAQLRRERLDPRRAVLLELGPCTGGTPAWTARHPQLRARGRARRRGARARRRAARPRPPRPRRPAAGHADRLPRRARHRRRAPTSPTTRPSTPTPPRRRRRSTSRSASSTRSTRRSPRHLG